jgi:hypothetical protein
VIASIGKKKRDATSLAAMDKIIAGLKSSGIEPRLSYNKYYVALGSTGNNLCWFHPRKTPGFCHVDFKLSSEIRDPRLEQFQKAGIDASSRGTERIIFSVNNKTVDERLSPIIEILKEASTLANELDSRVVMGLLPAWESFLICDAVTKPKHSLSAQNSLTLFCPSLPGHQETPRSAASTPAT